MVNETPPDQNQTLETEKPGPDSPQDSDWGEDWESAFQAEEYLFSEEEADADLAPSLGYADAEADGDADVAPDAAATTDFKASSHRLLTGIETLARALLPKKLRLPAGIAGRINDWAASLSAKSWLAITSILTLLLLFSIVVNWRGGADRPVPPPAPIADLDVATTTAPPTGDVPPAAPAPLPAKTAEVVVPPQVDRHSKKWTFAPFLIPTTDQETKEVTFVTIDLALISALEAQAELPQDKKPMVRNIIFQFFSNRPLQELRRYSLARGEMNRKLLEWIRTEWPEGAVEGIIFNRYQIG